MGTCSANCSNSGTWGACSCDSGYTGATCAISTTTNCTCKDTFGTDWTGSDWTVLTGEKCASKVPEYACKKTFIENCTMGTKKCVAYNGGTCVIPECQNCTCGDTWSGYSGTNWTYGDEYSSCITSVPSTLVLTNTSGFLILLSTWLSAAKLTT